MPGRPATGGGISSRPVKRNSRWPVLKRVRGVIASVPAMATNTPEALDSSRTKRAPSFTRKVACRGDTKASSGNRMAPRWRPTTQPVTGSL